MRHLAILTAAATMLMGVAAHADEAFDGFRNFCVATKGVPGPAMAAADAAGWQPVPQQLLDQQTQFPGAQGRVHSGLGGTLVLLTATGNLPQIGPARNCMIGVVPAGSSDLAGQLQAFAAVPQQVNPNQPEGFYVWRDDNGRHVPVDQNAPDFNALVISGAAMIATTQSQPQMTMIVLMSAAQ